MRLSLFFFLLLWAGSLRAQVKITDFGVRAGGTRAMWSGFFDFNSLYTGNYGWYGGVSAEIKIGEKIRKTALEAQLNYRFLQLGFRYNPDQLEMSELVAVVRPTYQAGHFKFGLEYSLSLSTNKEIHQKGPDRRVPLTFTFNEYSSLAGAIEFAIGKSISLELVQSFLHTPVRRFQSCGISGRVCEYGYSYQRVTQLGLRYYLSKNRRDR